MTVAILADLHFDAFNGLKQERFYDYQKDFFDNYFFPRIIEDEIKTVVQMGDLFDVRTRVSQRSLHFAKKIFFDRLRDYDIQLIVLTGNHDIYYRDSLEIVTAEKVLGEYSNIRLIKEPTALKLEGKSYTFIPWICKSNVDQVKNFIANDKSEIAFGHLEIAGAKLSKHSVMHHGTDSKLVAKYKKVYSGHYHTKSTFGNIEYLGMPYELTRVDANDQKSWVIIEDGKPDQIIKTPIALYEQLIVNTKEELTALLNGVYNKKYVEIFIEYEETPKNVNSFSEKFNEKFNTYELSIVTKAERNESDSLLIDVGTIKNNTDLISMYNTTNNLSEDVGKKLLELYERAVSVEK
jgi:DNA repair exonuclease SbcCD nuclease subunit